MDCIPIQYLIAIRHSVGRVTNVRRRRHGTSISAMASWPGTSLGPPGFTSAVFVPVDYSGLKNGTDKRTTADQNPFLLGAGKRVVVKHGRLDSQYQITAPKNTTEPVC